jgi:heat shock protein HslJ
MTSKPIIYRRDKSTTLRLAGLLLIVAILLAACSQETPTPVLPPSATDTPVPPPEPTTVVVDVNLLYANPWTLLAYGEPSNPTVVEEGVTLTAEFTPDGQINGFSGCNNYSGTFQAAQDGTLTISPLATTRMACAKGMDLETVYLSALQNARRFSFNDQGRLEILFGNESDPDQVLVYASSAKPLTGTNWILISSGDPAAPLPVPADVVITAVFTPDNYVSGFSGCNQYNASYILEDQQITIGPIASTMMACPTGMEFEQTYLQALGAAEQVAISGQVLTITYNQGAGVLTYTASDLPLEQTQWSLSTMNDQPLEADTSITAVFTPGEEANTGELSGSSGCNNYSAIYRVDGSNLTVDVPVVTLMACPTGMEQEQAYLQALQASTSYEIFADKLVLTNPSGTLMFTANRTPLTGALWRLVSLGDATNPQPPVEGSNFTAQFIRIPGAPSGVLAGTTGCNEYSAAFAASLEEIKINLPASTQNMTCVPGLSDQEQLYFLALNNATTYRISGNTLTIPYDAGKQALVFEGTQLETAVRPPLANLDGTTWFLWYMNNTPVLAGTSLYAQFAINADGASGTMSGSAGCNSYVANFGQDLGVQTTLNAYQVCAQPAGIMEQESAYLDMLSRAYGYWQTGDQLIVNTGLGVLTYNISQAPASYDQTHLLVGKTWYLVSYKDVYSEPGTQEPYTVFNTDGTLTGYTGCNTFQGNFTTNIQQITITNLNATLQACPNDELQAQEEAMLEILGFAKSYQVVDTSMQIIADQGVLNYSLTPLNRPEEVQPPQAVIYYSGVPQVGQVVTFDGTGSTTQLPITKYKWDFGDGTTGSGPVVEHVFNNPGTYQVTLTVTDQEGTKDSEVAEIAITPPLATPPPTLAPLPTPEGTPTPEPTQAPQPTPEPTQAPELIPPQASIQGPVSGYVGDPQTFDASGSVPGSSPIVSYSWNFGDGTTAGPAAEPQQTTIFNQAGIFQVSVVVTDQNGLSSSATMDVSMSVYVQTPVLWALSQLGHLPMLPGTSITLQFLGGQIEGFAGCNEYNGSYVATPNGDGTYSVTITGIITTSMSCPEEVMLQEGYYLAMLSGVITAQPQGDALTLSFLGGTGPDGQPFPDGSLIYYMAPQPK